MEIINGKYTIDNGLSVVGGITGSLSGSVGFATTASFALVAALDELQGTLVSQVFG